MRVTIVVLLVIAGWATVRASAQSASQLVYFTYFGAKTDPSTGKMDCDLGFLLPQEAQLRMTLQMNNWNTKIDFSFQATTYSQFILTAQPPNTENVNVSMYWPNTGDRKTVDAHAFLLVGQNAVDQTILTDTVDSGLLYELANSGSDVTIQFSGSRGNYTTTLPQKGLNGLQQFTAHCL